LLAHHLARLCPGQSQQVGDLRLGPGLSASFQRGDVEGFRQRRLLLSSFLLYEDLEPQMVVVTCPILWSTQSLSPGGSNRALVRMEQLIRAMKRPSPQYEPGKPAAPPPILGEGLGVGAVRPSPSIGGGVGVGALDKQSRRR